MDTVSIIVPVYGAADFIKETIEMVRQQTYTDWELVLVEDCSKDNTKEVLQNLEKEFQDERIKVIYKEHNEGAAKARNTGLDMVNTRYVAFLDADDVWFSDKLEKEMAFMKAHDAGFVFTAYEFGDEDAKGTGKLVKVPLTLNYNQALSRTIIFTSTVLFDTEKIDKTYLYMPNVPSEDSATWWRILREGHLAYGLNEVTTIYRRPKKSLSSDKGEAIKRIWFLYRDMEKLSLPKSCVCFVGWAIRATLRRLV